MNGFDIFASNQASTDVSGSTAFPVRKIASSLASGKTIASISLALAMAGCAANPQQVSGRAGGVDAKYGVTASPRVVADGAPVPHGGGNYMVVAANVAWLRTAENGQTQVGIIGGSPLLVAGSMEEIAATIMAGGVDAVG